MARPGLRERKKSQTRERIREHAIRLFLEHGYEATTVAEVAAAADVSHMTFFRHFPSKQDVVDFDDDPGELAGLIKGRPAGEGPLEAVHGAMLELLARHDGADQAGAMRLVARLIMDNAPLRAWLWEKHRARERVIAEALAHRSNSAPTLEHRAVAAAGVAAAGAAFAAWAVDDTAPDLRTALDEAFLALYKAAEHVRVSD